MSSVMTSNLIRQMVSKNKRRFRYGEYDLDLSYIERDKNDRNLIAMGFPAEKLEGVYRNRIDMVYKFLEEHHEDKYKIYNLCSERSYDPNKWFHGRVVVFAFNDHCPPPLPMISLFCKDVDDWLKRGDKYIAAVHCKAGKGRTGVMLCCYLLHRGQFTTAKDAQEFYGQKRTSDGKGVTIPSQQRYITYYEKLLKSAVEYKPVVLLLRAVRFETIPNFNSGTCCPWFGVYSAPDSGGKPTVIGESPVFDGAKKGDPDFEMKLKNPITVCGDFVIKFFNKTKVTKREKMFHCYLNTFFIDNVDTEDRLQNGNLGWNTYVPVPTKKHSGGPNPALAKKEEPFCRYGEQHVGEKDTVSSIKSKGECLTLTLEKKELDKANKDKNEKFDSHFKVKFIFMATGDYRYRPSPIPLKIAEKYRVQSDLSHVEDMQDSSKPQTKRQKLPRSSDVLSHASRDAALRHPTATTTTAHSSHLPHPAREAAQSGAKTKQYSSHSSHASPTSHSHAPHSVIMSSSVIHDAKDSSAAAGYSSVSGVTVSNAGAVTGRALRTRSTSIGKATTGVGDVSLTGDESSPCPSATGISAGNPSSSSGDAPVTSMHPTSARTATTSVSGVFVPAHTHTHQHVATSSTGSPAANVSDYDMSEDSDLSDTDDEDEWALTEHKHEGEQTERRTIVTRV